MWGFIVSLLMAFIIGWIGDALVKGSMPGGILGAIVAGFAGTWLGTLLLGAWGPVIAGFPLIPGIIGSALIVFLFGLMGKALRRT